MGQVRKLLFQAHDPYEGLAPLPFNNHGWGSVAPVFQKGIDTAFATGGCGLIIEIGTWMGGSARTMGEYLKAQYANTETEIVCVDTFLGSMEHWNRTSYLMSFTNGHPTVYHHFLSNTLHAGLQDIITPFPCDSINACETLKYFNVVADLIYIDAGHDYESVAADIKRWRDVLRPEGVLLLDDAHHPPIIQAVNEAFGDTVTQQDNKFVWIKPKA